VREGGEDGKGRERGFVTRSCSIGDNFDEKGMNAIGRGLSTNQMEEKREKMYATFSIEKNRGGSQFRCEIEYLFW
jgi:hypothetical protein